MPTLVQKLATCRPFTVMVIGDFMIDNHVYGAAERLSPDAPVPVLHVSESDHRAGGAANVAACLRALHGEVKCFGVVGADDEGRQLRAALAADGCGVEGLIEDPSRRTTVKRSFIGLAQHRHPQKMFRVDVEDRAAIAESVVDHLFAQIAAAADDVDIICIEDYDKGVCTETLCRRVIELGRDRGRPVLVDPAAIDDFTKYRGATAITPNRSEAERATGVDGRRDVAWTDSLELATRLRLELDLEAVVITVDKHGAILDEGSGGGGAARGPVVVPTVARDVYDVTGAGDVVLAALACARANDLTWLEAVQFANAAAGLEVEVFGAQPIAFARVQREVLKQERSLAGKVRTLEELLVEVAVHRHAGETIVFTNGCFDVVHAGHVAYLREAREQGDVLIVAVNGDEQVRAQKGEGRPLNPIADRLEVLSEMQSVDYVLSFDEPTAHALLAAIRPDVYVKGGDYRREEINEIDVVDELQLDLRIVAHRPGLSSTGLVAKARPRAAPLTGGKGRPGER